MTKLWCIPDIHGRLDLLEKLWNDLVSNHGLDVSVDKVIFLGDMIDRGPDSYEVLCKVKDLTESYPDNVVALMGNHESMPLLYYGRNKRPDDSDLWFNNGGLETLASYAKIGLNSMSHDHLLWISRLPLKHEEPGYFMSHAPAPREAYRNIVNRGLSDFTPDELTWTYHSDEQGVARDHGNGIIGVSGHIHQLKKGIMAPRLYSQHYYLDSGCGCSSKAPLVAMELHSKKIVYAWP